jgi:hypothetical protein
MADGPNDGLDTVVAFKHTRRDDVRGVGGRDVSNLLNFLVSDKLTKRRDLPRNRPYVAGCLRAARDPFLAVRDCKTSCRQPNGDRVTYASSTYAATSRNVGTLRFGA